MAKTPAPFSAFEWMIAWRYLRARRAEGGTRVELCTPAERVVGH